MSGFETFCGNLPGFDTATGLNHPGTKLFQSVLQYNCVVGNFSASVDEVPVDRFEMGDICRFL